MIHKLGSKGPVDLRGRSLWKREREMSDRSMAASRFHGPMRLGRVICGYLADLIHPPWNSTHPTTARSHSLPTVEGHLQLQLQLGKQQPPNSTGPIRRSHDMLLIHVPPCKQHIRTLVQSTIKQSNGQADMGCKPVSLCLQPHGEFPNSIC